MISPKINILVLNWNGEKVLCDCVKSIVTTDYSNYNLTIIDNGSTDSSVKSIDKSIFKKIKFIKIEKNLGYAKAYNYAFNKLIDNNDDYYLLLNNDTIIQKDTISKLILALNKYGENNIYGSKIINYFNKTIWYAGGKINSFTFSANNVGINTIDKIIEFKSRKTDFISGCSLFISKNIINQLGGFNEIYKFYYEDVDLCLRAKSLNINSIFINNSIVAHKISHSMGGRYSFIKAYYKLVSKIKFIFNNNRFLISILYLIINIILSPFYFFYKIIGILLK